MWIIYVIIVLIGGAFATCHETKYAIWGRTADAFIFGAKEEKFRKKENTFEYDYVKRYVIRYRWTDEDDGERKDKMTMPEGWHLPDDRIIEIDYLPGAMDSRPAGERNLGGPIIFFATGAGLIGVFGYLWWHGSRTG